MPHQSPHHKGHLRRADPLALGLAYAETLPPARRAALGIHYTPEATLLLLVEPTLGRPLRARREAAPDAASLRALHRALTGLRVLDPAVGGGAFLVAALRVLAREERALLAQLGEVGPLRVSAAQLCGIDLDQGALEVAARAVALEVEALGLAGEPRLIAGDALVVEWPPADVILGNPPFVPKSRLHHTLGRRGVEALRARFPAVSGKADYCVYWFHLAHAHLGPGGRAGLVGTNTIRETSSRAGGLDDIEATGTIVDAVSSMPWPGAAGVHVSLVSWVKGPSDEPRTLHLREDSGLRAVQLPHIHAGLSGSVDVASARPLPQNQRPKTCFQGVTHGHAAFALSQEEGEALVAREPRAAPLLHPYLTAEDLLLGRAGRLLLDPHPLELDEVPEGVLEWLRQRALPDRQAAAAREAERNVGAGGASHHRRFLDRWWWPSWPRPALKEATSSLGRVLVCPRYAARPVFAFLPAAVRPSDLLQVFALEDDYSFGVLQSRHHRAWAEARSSTLITTPRYTSSTVWDSFPWPLDPDPAAVRAISEAARAVQSLREGDGRPLGEQLRVPTDGAAAAQEALDLAVAGAYGHRGGGDPLEALLALNLAGRAGAPGPPGGGSAGRMG